MEIIVDSKERPEFGHKDVCKQSNSPSPSILEFPDLPETKRPPSLEVFGEFIVDWNDIIADKPTSRVFRATKSGDDAKSYVCKVRDIEQYNASFEDSNDAGNIDDVETYLHGKGFIHPNVVIPEKRFERGGRLVRFYEDAGSTNLEEYIANNKKLTIVQARAIVSRVGSGIAALNAVGVARIDIAPENIMLSQNDLKIIDLDGASIDLTGNGDYEKKYMRGNRFSMAPELFEQKPSFDQTVDVYSSAAMFYRLVVGDWPYNIEEYTWGLPEYEQRMSMYKRVHESGNIGFPEEVPEEIQQIIKKGMSPNASDRYQSMNEFLKALSIIDAS